MNIQGLQKTTLLDFPSKVACLIFTGGCNFRCPFCQNSSLVINPPIKSSISDEEFFEFLEKRRNILDGVCITGGEPLLNIDIADFIRKIRTYGLMVKLDTNGSLPNVLGRLIDEKLVDYVAMDIKNSRRSYYETAGTEHINLEKIDESIQLLMSDRVDYEFRTTVVDEFHTVEDAQKIGEWLKGAKRLYLQKFKDSGSIIGSGLHSPSMEKLEQMKAILEQYVQHVEIR